MLQTSMTNLILFVMIGLVAGHGRLWDPPSRSSMFRKGFKTPPNYNDNQLSCGGYSYQWGRNGGKCGICGDPYDQKRENEAGGKYATGTIAAKYQKGQKIDITVDITANHKGWFEFRLCPNNNVKKPATQACLDKYLLQLADGSGTRDYIGSVVGMRTRKWLLPPGLTCTQCVMQWKWHVGNSWGRDANGTGCIGCGPQEEFYGCADIAIEDPNPKVTNSPTVAARTTTTKNVVMTSTNKPTPSPTTTTQAATTTSTTLTTKTTTPPTTKTTPISTTTTPVTTTTTTISTTTTPITTPTTPISTTTTPTTTTTSATMPTTASTFLQTTTIKHKQQQKNPYIGKNCGPTQVWKKTPGMKGWCTINCRRNFCPASHCVCV